MKKSMLVLYDVLCGRLQIMQGSHDIISFKNKNFESIFPNYIAQEGNKKILNILSDNASNTFDFYLKHESKGNSIEKFKMKFMGIPSMNNDNMSIYIVCNYILMKHFILVFSTFQDKKKNSKVLIDISDAASTTLKITKEIIDLSLESKNYITYEDIVNTKLKIIDFPAIKEILHHRFKIEKIAQQNVANTYQKKYNIKLNEKFGNIEIYSLYNGSKIVTNEYTTNVGNSLISESQEKTNVEILFNATNTGMSSSTFTKTSASTYNRVNNNIKNQQDFKYRQFYKYTYYIISFNILILIVISVFLAVELVNNKNICDFQSHFFHIVLSIFSLTCNSDFLSQIDCTNYFVTYSDTFATEHGLTVNELMSEYISRESSVKADMIISTLKDWENDQYTITSNKLTQIMSEPFSFTTLEEVNTLISPVNLDLTFEEAIKRFVNTINLLTSIDEFITSPVFIIKINGTYVDMENARREKEPIDGAYLNEAQKYYYTILINYQRYLQRLLSISDVLYEYFDDMITKTS